MDQLMQKLSFEMCPNSSLHVCVCVCVWDGRRKRAKLYSWLSTWCKWYTCIYSCAAALPWPLCFLTQGNFTSTVSTQWLCCTTTKLGPVSHNEWVHHESNLWVTVLLSPKIQAWPTVLWCHLQYLTVHWFSSPWGGQRTVHVCVCVCKIILCHKRRVFVPGVLLIAWNTSWK